MTGACSLSSACSSGVAPRSSSTWGARQRPASEPRCPPGLGGGQMQWGTAVGSTMIDVGMVLEQDPDHRLAPLESRQMERRPGLTIVEINLGAMLEQNFGDITPIAPHGQMKRRQLIDVAGIDRGPMSEQQRDQVGVAFLGGKNAAASVPRRCGHPHRHRRPATNSPLRGGHRWRPHGAASPCRPSAN